MIRERGIELETQGAEPRPGQSAPGTRDPCDEAYDAADIGDVQRKGA